MVQNRIVTMTALKKISGVGDARADKYGGQFMKMGP
jgi:hypothetical protein